MRPAVIVLMALSWAACAWAQSDESPSDRRYLNPVFTEVKLTENLVFAKKLNDLSGTEETLRLRVFEPAGDSERRRPLFLLTPGGGFVVNGDDWMNDVATEIAKAGYVVAINKYRLSKSIETPALYMQALAKAVADQRDALAYLVADAEGENRFGIDPERVFIGGHSAGAITSMHMAYLDRGDSLNEMLRAAMAAQFEVPAKQAEPAIKGVINLAGLVSDLQMINRQDIPLLSIHGADDAVVTPDRNAEVFGSKAIHEYLDLVGTDNTLYLIEGARHNDTALPYLCEECVPLMKRFMFNQLQTL